MCVDFRDLNSATVDDSFPLPRIEVLLYKAAQSQVFSKLDLASGFHQIEVNRSFRPLTAFRLPKAVEGSALWQWKVMPIWAAKRPTYLPACNVPGPIGLRRLFHVVYIDDILIFSNTEEEHLEHLRRVFAKLVNHAYHVRLQKYEFIKEEVEFLGHHITPSGIRTVESKVIAVREWPMPLTTPKQVKAFLGLVMWYHAFIPHLATIAYPLFALTSPRVKFAWTEIEATTVKQLQQALTTRTCLSPMGVGQENMGLLRRVEGWRGCRVGTMS